MHGVGDAQIVLSTFEPSAGSYSTSQSDRTERPLPGTLRCVCAVGLDDTRDRAQRRRQTVPLR
jgi:hypothetical protein